VAIQSDSNPHTLNPQESQSSGEQHEHRTESSFIHNVEMAQEFCDDEEENFRFFTLEELEDWATLLSEYQHDRYKHLTPYFEQAQEILKTVQAFITSHTST